jgi:hypothetical protein
MRGRRALVLSMVVVAVGVLTAVAAYYLDPGRGSVGPMPGVGLALPADTRMVTGIDVPRLVRSPLYQRFFSGASRPQAFTELQARTGLRAERDVEHVLLSSQGQEGRAGAVALVSGTFDRQRVVRSVEGQRGVGSRTHEGRALYVFHPEGAPSTALAFLEDDVLALGTEAEVEKAVTAYARGTGGLRGNAELLALVQSIKPGVTVWSAGDKTLLGRLPSSLPAGGGLPAMTLPGLKSVVFSGDVEPAVAFEAVVQTEDAKSAQQIAGLAGMMIAMARMQGGQRPEMQQLASAVTVTTDESRVRVNGSFSDELLAALQKSQGPRRPAPPAESEAAPPGDDEPR